MCPYSTTCKKYKINKCNPNEFCIKKFKLDYLYSAGLFSETQKKYSNIYIDSDGTDKDKFITLRNIQDNIESFVKNGKNLYIYSTMTGNGKTLWATRLAQSYFQAIWHKCDLTCKVAFVSVPKFLLELKANISKKSQYIEALCDIIDKVDLVIWDDIGTKNITEYESENLLSIIDSRITSGKSNIFTSNISPEEMFSILGGRLSSRITGLSITIELKGKDKRSLAK